MNRAITLYDKQLCNKKLIKCRKIPNESTETVETSHNENTKKSNSGQVKTNKSNNNESKQKKKITSK